MTKSNEAGTRVYLYMEYRKTTGNDIGLSNIQQCEIQRSHRLGPKFNQNRNLRSSSTNPTKTPIRPIIVKFTNYNTRLRVYKDKKELKGKNISISEKLTRYRYNLLKKAVDKYWKNKGWSQDGRIMTKINDRYVTITSAEDLH